jgi:Zn-dependent protease with chaperone function
LVPTSKVSGHLASLLAMCVMTVQARYAHPGGAGLAAVGAVLILVVLSRVTWCTSRALAHAWRTGQRHCQRLRAIGRPEGHLGALVVDYGQPAVYCLPGTGQPIVLTSAVMDVLDEAQLAAVLAHEGTHQQGRHHLLMLIARSLEAAFPWISAFRLQLEQITRLVELAADDAAAKTSPRLKVAEALLALGAPASGPPGPCVAAPMVLAANASPTGARIRRLLGSPTPLSRSSLLAGKATLCRAKTHM